MRKFALFLTCLLWLATGRAALAEEPDSTAAKAPASLPVIAVADFSGEDQATGRFLADSLLTDLSQSSKLRLVERTELRRALSELKLQDTGLFEPNQVQALGKLVRADQLIVGSYLLRDNQILINVRLLDVGTGRVVAGDASNINGDARDLLMVVHRLAHLFHYRITGSEFAIDGEGAITSSPESGRWRNGVRPVSQAAAAQSQPAPTRSPDTDSVIARARQQTRDLNYSDNSNRIPTGQTRETNVSQVTPVRYIPTVSYAQPVTPVYVPRFSFPIEFRYSSPSYSVSYIRRSALERPRLRVSYGARSLRHRRY